MVLLQVPGAVLTPWRDDVDGILALFLGGRQTGEAWGSVLFEGGHSPTGKLPRVIPAAAADTIPPDRAATVRYTEGMATSYRNTRARPAFAFGHGLGYTTFAYTDARVVP